MTSVVQTILNVLEFDMSMQEAVNAPRFHHQWLPETVAFEKNFPETTIKEIGKLGYKAEKWGQIGRTEMILIDDEGNIHAVADGRGDDSVAVE